VYISAKLLRSICVDLLHSKQQICIWSKSNGSDSSWEKLAVGSRGSTREIEGEIGALDIDASSNSSCSKAAVAVHPQTGRVGISLASDKFGYFKVYEFEDDKHDYDSLEAVLLQHGVKECIGVLIPAPTASKKGDEQEQDSGDKDKDKDSMMAELKPIIRLMHKLDCSVKWMDMPVPVAQVVQMPGYMQSKMVRLPMNH
jgi:hypothetical protein